MNDLAEGEPEFAAAMRGYDRLQVDDYVARLRTLLAEAEERARIAASQQGMEAYATVGPRVTEIFDLAMAESGELRARVQAEADDLLADAQRRADELVAAAQRDSDAIAIELQAQRQDTLAEIEGEREVIQRQVTALETRKGHLVDELRRLQGALGSAADSVADSHAEPPSWNDAGQTETIELPPSDPAIDR